MMVDTVFNTEKRPVFVHPPDVVRRRLKAGCPDTWLTVHIGETGEIVTIAEYLYAEMYAEVQQMIYEIMHKQTLSVYQRDKKKLKIQVERTARKMIERVLKQP